LATGAIAQGQEVRVSYDYVPAEGITYCPSDARTQAIMKASVEKTMEVVKPRHLHIGHDEPRFINRDSRCKAQKTTATQLYTDDINRLYQWAKAKDPSVTLMMWSDALRVDDQNRVQLAWHSQEKDTLESVAARIPRDILQGPWEYSQVSPELHERMLTSLLAQGYQVTGSPWYTLSNVYSWVEAARRVHPAGPNLLGLFLTTWDNRWEADAMVAEYNWSLAKPVFNPEQPDFEEVLASYFSRFQ
jgi:hypothetical protein